MPTYVAFLRAINLGKYHQFPKAAIVAATEAAGCTDVATHINTGNVLVTSRLRSAAKLAEALERAYLADRGFEVPVIAFTPAEVLAIAARCDELAVERAEDRQYVLLCKDQPSAAIAADIEGRSTEMHQARVRGRAIHLLFGPRSASTGDPFNLEKSVGIATNRNATVIRAIAEKWCAR